MENLPFQTVGASPAANLLLQMSGALEQTSTTPSSPADAFSSSHQEIVDHMAKSHSTKVNVCSCSQWCFLLVSAALNHCKSPTVTQSCLLVCAFSDLST